MVIESMEFVVEKDAVWQCEGIGATTSGGGCMCVAGEGILRVEVKVKKRESLTHSRPNTPIPLHNEQPYSQLVINGSYWTTYKGCPKYRRRERE